MDMEYAANLIAQYEDSVKGTHLQWRVLAERIKCGPC